jgi:hypothetical protein
MIIRFLPSICYQTELLFMLGHMGHSLYALALQFLCLTNQIDLYDYTNAHLLHR